MQANPFEDHYLDTFAAQAEATEDLANEKVNMKNKPAHSSLAQTEGKKDNFASWTLCLDTDAEQQGLADQFEEILVPTEEVVEVRRGRKINAERKFFPGYVLAKMEMSDEAYHLVKNTPKVTGFLGADNKPQPISQAEVDRILHQVQEGVERPKSTISFEVGEEVRVSDGPFASFNGVVEGVDEERARLKVSVSIFGRSTPVELEYTQVEKL